MHTETIGTAQTYTTIQGWEDGRDGVLTEIEKGQCLGEAFDEDVTIDGSTTASDKYMWLTSVAGAEHDGRANEVSSAGNARIEGNANVGKVYSQDEYFRIDWMEVYGNSTDAAQYLAFYSNNIGACTVDVHHNIFHNNQKDNSNDCYGVRPNDSSAVWRVHHNIIYGFGGIGLSLGAAAANSEAFNNTVYECNSSDDVALGGLLGTDADWNCNNNIAFNNGTSDFVETAGTYDYNADSDGSGSGENSISPVTSVAAELTNPTTTWANTDLTIKDTDAQIYGSGINGSDAGFEDVCGGDVDVNVPISDRNATLDLEGSWSMGADDIIAAGGSILLLRLVME